MSLHIDSAGAGEKYEVSLKAAERVLLPAVRHAAPEAIIVTDGFSCHHQIEELSDRESLHLAQVLELALGGAPCDASLRHRRT